jgi:hypothetical protein
MGALLAFCTAVVDPALFVLRSQRLSHEAAMMLAASISDIVFNALGILALVGMLIAGYLLIRNGYR